MKATSAIDKFQHNPKLHPTALHMQFQAELNLFDTFNESLRQVTDVENSLYNAQHEHCTNNVKDNKESETKDLGSSENEKAESKVNGKATKAVEVQTQTANDIATQTESPLCRSLNNSQENFEKLKDVIYRQHSDSADDSINESVDLEKLEQVSLPSKMRAAVSEISLHETTSSIRTESGTEISISTRDVTCSFNKHLESEMAQLIIDEKQRYDKIEMLFKSHEKTLNDRTKKLVKLEEQKRALRDAGQDQQISSVKKKQRALLLKLQQEKEEMTRLKELHKIASQERKLMLQKQRDMFNPEMSTKNIRTKLKRSADSQSPRRLSGPMKGYDIRSNSSMSSLVDSDRSQLKVSQMEGAPVLSSPQKPEKSINVSQEEASHAKYDLPSRSFEEKMPRADILRLKHLSNEDCLENGQDPDALIQEILKKSKFSGDKKLDAKASSKRKSSKVQKVKPGAERKSEEQILEELLSQNHGKRSKVDSSEENCEKSILEEVDFNESQGSLQALLQHSKDLDQKNYQLLHEIAREGKRSESRKDVGVRNLGNISTRSQVSTYTKWHHSSGENEKSFSQSVVIRGGHDIKHSEKLEHILNAREAALASRRSGVKEWIAWHARLREEENRVARMEETALKLVSAASKALPYHDTTVSSDTSDVEGRIEELTKKLADRRVEMTILKKEARRQAKQQLHALEANLLNQIKKYDTTINEMRKKLETKKSSTRDNEKLAIEAKSLADFKVPEIPIKSVKDIYKSDDLSRSKSEPLLVPSKRTKPPISDLVNHVTSDTEEIRTVHQSQHETRSATPEDVSGTKVSSQGQPENSENSLSKNLRSIQFHNKDLNENISILENDFKSLSEMMSSYSRKSNENLKSIRMLSQGTEIPTELTSVNDISKSKDTEIEEVLSGSGENTDYEARSKEILNEIERSIISENVDFEAGMGNLYKENEALSKDLNSLEADIESISEFILKSTKSKSERESYDTKTFEESKETDLIETVIDSSETSENQGSTLVQDSPLEKVKSNEEPLLQDLKETDVDSWHEFDGSKEERFEESWENSESLPVPKEESGFGDGKIEREIEVDAENSELKDRSESTIEEIIEEAETIEEFFSEKASEENQDLARLQTSSGENEGVKEETERSVLPENSDGEQTDNLIEVAESGLETREKVIIEEVETPKNDKSPMKPKPLKTESKKLERAQEIVRESEYSDISEESMEVSEIMEFSEVKKHSKPKKLLEKEKIESEEVIGILSELSKSVEEQEEISAQSEASGDGETPRGVPDIETDSPRDLNDTKNAEENEEKKESKQSETYTSAVSSSEKDIEDMINSLKASLDQPGLEVTELEAKMLKIEQLRIELEIKRLEAEESLAYYVREIPNKPPPPYTPPGTGRAPTSQGSPSPPPAVVPTSLDELTAFTEKATRLIFDHKKSGQDIASLEVPNEICELSKDDNEISKRDRRIYNTFLFDLCKEIVHDVYKCEDERPGPSWTKPEVQLKVALDLPRTFEDLNEHVSKEVALLFGFKTKVQRENMVTRWTKKRKDRVDELLAQEAQAQEVEWTKFHYDELTVKNELTVAILETLLTETANVAKRVCAKERKMMV